MVHYDIIGPGALGLLWAARLAPLCQVSLWGRQGAVDASFVLVESGTPPRSVVISRPMVVNTGFTPGVVLVMTKSHDALPAIRHTLNRWDRAPQALVLFQNGIDSQESIVRQFPNVPVIAATTTEGANRRPDGTLAHGGKGLTRLGLLNPPGSKAAIAGTQLLSVLIADFSSSGFDTREETDIRAALWDKLLINAGINPFTVLLDKANGGLPGDSFFENHIGPLSQELSSVSLARGYGHTAEAIEAQVRHVLQTTASNVSSMLQDARAGRRTEIDFINGSVVALGRLHATPVPINRMLWQAVSDRTTGRQQP